MWCVLSCKFFTVNTTGVQRILIVQIECKNKCIKKNGKEELNLFLSEFHWKSALIPIISSYSSYPRQMVAWNNFKLNFNWKILKELARPSHVKYYEAFLPRGPLKSKPSRLLFPYPFEIAIPCASHLDDE